MPAPLVVGDAVGDGGWLFAPQDNSLFVARVPNATDVPPSGVLPFAAWMNYFDGVVTHIGQLSPNRVFALAGTTVAILGFNTTDFWSVANYSKIGRAHV